MNDLGVTCCIAIRCAGGLVAAADTEISYGDVRAYRAHKITRGRAGLLMSAGSGGSTDELARRWRQAGNLSGLLRLLRDPQVLAPKERGEVEFLYVGRHGARVVDGYGCVMTPQHPFAAIGVGNEVAIGYLGALVRRDLELHRGVDIARRCLRFVASNVANVGGPFEVEVYTPGGVDAEQRNGAGDLRGPSDGGVVRAPRRGVPKAGPPNGKADRPPG